MSDSINITQDFIFGTLATDELRLAALQAAARGLTHANRIEPADPEPGQAVELSVSAGPDVDAEAVFAVYTLDGGDPDEGAPRIDLTPGASAWDTLVWGYRREWTGHLPPQPEGTLVRYRVAARRTDGGLVWAEVDPETGRPATFAYHVDREHIPQWVRDAVIYQVFVDRFNPGEGRAWQPAAMDGFFGGTIRGVIEALPYLERLGVTCLWLSPVFPSPTHHGYDATAYDDVEPRLGSKADLVALFDAAHALGMRVLLDFVVNHVSNQHPAFDKALANPSAPERAWFTFRGNDYRAFFGVTSMPQIDTENAAARGYMIEAACDWLRLGADGFRLDYANGPPHAFWAAFRAATRAIKPDSFTVGEVVETAELQRSYLGRLDGTLDFLLLQHLRAFFAFDVIGADQFNAFLDRHLAYFPPDFVLPSFLDNHDMNRFLWTARGDARRLKLAAIFQFTLPHPPVIFYGTEVGLSQRRDIAYPDGSRRPEESRTPMRWGNDQDGDLLAFYTNLVAMRRRRPRLWRGRRQTLTADADGCLVVAITGTDDKAIVAVNRSERERQVTIPAGFEPIIRSGSVAVRLSNALELGPMSGAICIGQR